ncbi:MAG: alpha/beta hydrolase [Bdellovibrionaceae bacterium]|nr:alpha/beta hydrolase [Pseudobdellovibrionaceae bacterium]
MPRFQLSGFTMNCEIVPATLPMDTLFIHGNLASNRWWQPAIALWNQSAPPRREGRAILAEWRGCGQSSEPASEADLSIDVLAADYIRLLEALNISRVCLVGHSTGGAIGLMAMLQRPEFFHRAVFLDPVSATGIELDETMSAAFRHMGTDRAVLENRLGATIWGNDFASPFFQDLVADAYGVSRHNWLGVPRALQKFDVRERLAQVQTPILVAHGEHDVTLPIEKSKHMAEGLGNGAFLEIKGQGHCTNIENPKLFTSICNEFLYGN